MTEEKCTRKRIEIEGSNYYLIVGDDFVDVTVPHENRRENIPQRILLDTLCESISAVMAHRNAIKTLQDAI